MGIVEDTVVLFGPWLRIWYPDSWVDWFILPDGDPLLTLLTWGYLSLLILKWSTKRLKEEVTFVRILLWLGGSISAIWSLPGFLGAFYAALVIFIAFAIVFILFTGAISFAFELMFAPAYFVIEIGKGFWYIFRW